MKIVCRKFKMFHCNPFNNGVYKARRERNDEKYFHAQSWLGRKFQEDDKPPQNLSYSSYLRI